MPSLLRLWAFLLLLGLAPLAAASQHNAAERQQACYLDAIETAPATLTLGELRQRCAAAEPVPGSEARANDSALNAGSEVGGIARDPTTANADKKILEPTASFTQQIAAERQSLDRSYSLTPHLPNYLDKKKFLLSRVALL